jgi:hypothetical protein
LPTQLLVDVDLSAMVDCCRAALCFSGVIHEDSDGEPTGGTSMESAVAPRMASVASSTG